MTEPVRLPAVNTISFAAPFAWLGGAWADLRRAPLPFLLYGLVIAMFSAAAVLGLALTGLAFWAIALTAGFALVAPMAAMGVYEGGRLLEAGQRPTLARIAFVKSAFRPDVVLLGVALLIVFGIWLELAQVVFGIATSQRPRSLDAFIAFAANTPEGNGMLIWGSLIGGLIAWLTFSFVVVSAPMLLDRRADFFIAAVTSVRCVVRNTGPMLLWALIIAAMLLASILTGFAALIVVIPWLGLATWRAYRALVGQPVAPSTAT